MPTKRPTSTPADQEVDFAAGKRSATYTDIKDWVPLSGVSDAAVRYYGILRMHVNRRRGDRKVRATTLTLAKLMGRSRGDKTAPWLAELITIGAVEVRREGLSGRYHYTINEDPPDGYTGPVNLAEWYDRNRDELTTEREAARQKRDARREAQRAAKTLVKPDTPISGLQPDVAPMSGQPDTPMSGVPVAPTSGREPDVLEPDGVEPDEDNPPLPRARAKRGAARPPAQNQGGDESSKEQHLAPDPARQLVDEMAPILVSRGEVWKYLDQRTRAVLTELEGKGHPFPVIRLALLHLANGHYGPTSSPKRVLEMGGWWDQAYAEYRSSPAGYAPAQRVPCDDCDGVWRLEADRGPGTRRLPMEPPVRCTHKAMAGVS